MKLIRLDESKEKNPVSNGNVKCFIREYKMSDELDCAGIVLSGRYPAHMRVRNTKCKELAVVMEGNGFIVIEDYSHQLTKGDCVLIEPNERYYWFGGSGKDALRLFVSCTPAWTSEQHEIID